MEIIFLGTGTGAPSVRRAAPAVLVVAGGYTILVDSGAGTLRQLAKAGMSYNDLDIILYTHFHPDHVGDLVPYLFATKYMPGFTRNNPVQIWGPAGLVELYSNLKKAFGHWIEPPDGKVVFNELPIGVRNLTEFDGIKLVSGPVHHTPQSLGYRLTETNAAEPEETTVAITGDTDYGPDLVELARDVDLLITECSFPEGKKVEGHLTPTLAGRVAREGGARALVLNHFYPETDDAEIMAHVMSEYDGNITLAEDFLEITI